MKLLLDTHTLLWSIGKTNELSKKVIQEIKKADNEIFVSAVSLWEIALKSGIGRLFVSFNVNKIPEYCRKMGFTLIPLDPIDALSSLRLPQKDSHKDPFDRMLIFQCIKNEYVFISKDTQMKLYKDEGLMYLW
jgi:PIN domain nuclease of toxin-antitoxin system